MEKQREAEYYEPCENCSLNNTYNGYDKKVSEDEEAFIDKKAFIKIFADTAQEPRESKNGKWLQIVATLSGAMGTFTTGQLMGWASPAIPELQAENSPIPITSGQGGWVASLAMAGSLLAIPLVASTVNVIGRKKALLCSAIPILLSWLMIGFARNIETIYVARIFVGLGETYAKTTLFMYVGEIAEPRIRGALGTFLVVMLNLGIVFEYAIGHVYDCQTLALISASAPITLLATFIWMPESPYFLMMRGQADESERQLVRLRRNKNVEKELSEIRETIESQSKMLDALRKLFGRKVNRRALMITCTLFISQEFSGITPNIMYAKTILEKGGQTLIPASLASITVPLTKTVATLLTTVLVDTLGRRPLFMCSTLMCTGAMAFLSIYFYQKDIAMVDTSQYEWIPLIFMLTFNFMFIIGLGCLPFIIIGELFPTDVKAVAVCLSALCGPISSIVAVKMFQVLTDSFGVFSAFGVFSVCCLSSFVFVALFLPETKNKSLAQIQRYLKGETSAEGEHS